MPADAVLSLLQLLQAMSVYLSVRLSVCLSFCLSAYLPASLSVHLSLCIIHLSILVAYLFPIATTVSLSSTNYYASEGDGVANILLQLFRAAAREVTVFIETGDVTTTGSLGE